MKKQLTLSALLILLLATFVFAQVATSSIEGNWSGAIEAGGIKLRLVFKVLKTPRQTQRFRRRDQLALNGEHDLQVRMDSQTNKVKPQKGTKKAHKVVVFSAS